MAAPSPAAAGEGGLQIGEAYAETGRQSASGLTARFFWRTGI